jgi:hypothetical protein
MKQRTGNRERRTARATISLPPSSLVLAVRDALANGDNLSRHVERALEFYRSRYYVERARRNIRRAV